MEDNEGMVAVKHKSKKSLVIRLVTFMGSLRGLGEVERDTMDLIQKESSKYAGKYSLSKYLALQQYIQKYNTMQQIFHCLVPMVVSVTMTLIVLAPPYSKVSDGLFKNGVLPSTLFCGATAALMALLRLFKYYFKEANVSNFEIVWVASLGGITYTVTISLLAIFYCYPMPFSLIFPCFVGMPTVAIACYVVFGSRIRHLEKFQRAMKGYFSFVFLTVTMLNVYPFFLQLAQFFDGTSFEIFGMPILMKLLKGFLKAAMRRANHCADEPQPFVPVLVVNAFHIVYVSISLQKGASMQSLLFLMAMDIGGNLLQLMQLRRMLTLIDRENKLAASTTKAMQAAKARNEAKDSFNTPRKRSLVHHTESQGLLQRKLLFVSENIFLIEYVECIVPFQFCIICIFFYFHPNGEFMTIFFRDIFTSSVLEQTIQSLILYTLLEVIVLQVLGHIIVGRINIPFLSQLGYVLYQSSALTSTLLYFWLLYALAGTVVHFGHDWTFQFDWECIAAY